MAKNKILVIDDEPDFVNMVKMRLEANDYEVIQALEGESGLHKAETEHPDVILMDIMMPKKDGYTLLREFRTKDTTKLTPIIVITALAFLKEVFEIEGITDYITKPFDDKDLLFKIKRALSSEGVAKFPNRILNKEK